MNQEFLDVTVTNDDSYCGLGGRSRSVGGMKTSHRRRTSDLEMFWA